MPIFTPRSASVLGLADGVEGSWEASPLDLEIHFLAMPRVGFHFLIHRTFRKSECLKFAWQDSPQVGVQS